MDGRPYRLVEARSALNRVEGMPFRWSLNPYRGCAHDCVYCYARATHAYYDLGPADFARVLFVKTNLAERLREELGRPSWRRETVAVGTATDPYQPVEGTFRITRRCLEVCSAYRTPISLVTKGTLVWLDLDVLRELSERAEATVCFSVPTVDREIWRRTEPGTPPPAQRLKVMERLIGAGIRPGVLLAPLLPGLSADPDQIRPAVRAAAGHGARFIGADLLHLDPGSRVRRSGSGRSSESPRSRSSDPASVPSPAPIEGPQTRQEFATGAIPFETVPGFRYSRPAFCRTSPSCIQRPAPKSPPPNRDPFHTGPQPPSATMAGILLRSPNVGMGGVENAVEQHFLRIRSTTRAYSTVGTEVLMDASDLGPIGVQI